MEHEDQIKLAALLASITISKCYLCGAPSLMGGVWEPPQSNPIFGVGCKGTPKAMLYGLCLKCSEDEEAVSKVEAKASFVQMMGNERASRSEAPKAP
jgi:hypothetical protein